MEKDGFLFPLKLNLFYSIRFTDFDYRNLQDKREKKDTLDLFPLFFLGWGSLTRPFFLVVGWFSFPNSLHSVTRDDEQTAARWLKSLACKAPFNAKCTHTRMIRLLFFLAAVYGDCRDIVIPRKRRNFSCLFSLSLSLSLSPSLLLLSCSFFSSCRRRENRQNRTGSKPRNKMGRARMTTKKRWMMRALIALAHSDRTFFFHPHFSMSLSLFMCLNYFPI